MENEKTVDELVEEILINNDPGADLQGEVSAPRAMFFRLVELARIGERHNRLGEYWAQPVEPRR